MSNKKGYTIKEEVEITKVQFGIGTEDGFLTIRFPYGYSKIEGKFKKGDRVKIKIKYDEQ